MYHLFLIMLPKSYYFQLGSTPDLDGAYLKLKREKLVLTHYNQDDLSKIEADYFIDQLHTQYNIDLLGWFHIPIKRFLIGHPEFIFYEPPDKTYDPIEKYLRQYPDAYLTGANMVAKHCKQAVVKVRQNWRFRLLESNGN